MRFIIKVDSKHRTTFRPCMRDSSSCKFGVRYSTWINFRNGEIRIEFQAAYDSFRSLHKVLSLLLVVENRWCNAKSVMYFRSSK